MKRDWSDARAKVDSEKRCRVCRRRDCHIEAAHTVGREHDRRKQCQACRGRGTRDWESDGNGWATMSPPCKRCDGKGTTQELHVAPDSIVPLCGECHDRYDGRNPNRLDLLPHMTMAEQLRAVTDAGGIENARRRTCPALYARERGDVAVGSGDPVLARQVREEIERTEGTLP